MGAAFVSLIVALVSAAACNLLEVESPARVPDSLLEEPGNASLNVAGAIADFECAFDDYIVAGGLIGDELADVQGFSPLFDYDRRAFTEFGGTFATDDCDSRFPGVYQTLSTARFVADRALEILPTFSAQEVLGVDSLIATAGAYAGYSYLLLGEGMCSAAVDGGPEISSQGMFAAAESRFTDALSVAQSVGLADVTNMVLVGRARARINQGDESGAAADAQQVPPGFVAYARYTQPEVRPSNRIWVMNVQERAVSIEDDVRELTFGGQSDLRTASVLEPNPAQDGQSPLWTQSKYPSQDSPIPIARYEEAQLIIAEVQRGQNAVDIINTLHAAAGLPDFVPNDVNDDVEILGHVIEERRRELFLESHHLYDKIRFSEYAAENGMTADQLNPSLPFTPAAGEPFSKGGTYGNTTCLPLPLAEKANNPNIP
jgi:hypothetical protein